MDVGQKKIEQSSGGNGESEQWKYEKCFRRSFGKSLREVVLDLGLGKVRSVQSTEAEEDLSSSKKNG